MSSSAGIGNSILIAKLYRKQAILVKHKKKPRNCGAEMTRLRKLKFFHFLLGDTS
jgi:hypothetical protein